MVLFCFWIYSQGFDFVGGKLDWDLHVQGGEGQVGFGFSACGFEDSDYQVVVVLGLFDRGYHGAVVAEGCDGFW